MVGAMTAGMLAGCGSKAPADNTAKEEIPATEEAKEETPATEEKEAVEPVTLNVAYMPNYGSLWSVPLWSPEVSTLDISDRVLTSFVSMDRQPSSHYPISPMVMH